MRKSKLVSVLCVSLALLLALSGCDLGGLSGGLGGLGGGSSSGGGLGGLGGLISKPSTIDGNDIFQGERCNEMLWGYYEADCYDYTGSNEDTKVFLEGMKFITVGDEDYGYELSVLPLSLQPGKFTHFMGSFSYENEYYEAYTEKGRAMFRKAYMEQYGDLTEADFQKIEALFQLNVAELTFAGPEGGTRIQTLAYEVEGNQVSFWEVSVDEKYNYTLGEKPLLTCDFLHDGGKLILANQGVQRSYLASGYKDTDPSLAIEGYAENPENQYKDLEGFVAYQYGTGKEFSAYVYLSNDETAIDPLFELNKQTGEFTLSWQQRWVYGERGLEKQDDPQTITGTVVPCTSYGFTDYEGSFLFIDGTCYRYLMSEQEYEERKNAMMENAENLTQGEKDDLETIKRNILAELVEAFRREGIEASIDETTGQVALESNFLFGTDSYALSAEGKKYIGSFMNVYTSVVMREEYADYISKIIVEGHTDTSGSYSYNMTLSEKRANSVAQECISHTPAMEKVIEAKGCSYDYPVYNSNGSVNMEKSRRVTFRFVLGLQ